MLRLIRRHLAPGALVIALLSSGTAVVLALHRPATGTVAARPAAQATVSPSMLDMLRQEAVLGDERSSQALASALLDRYDTTGNSDDLYEAMVWIDRRWSMSGNAEMAPRILANYCGQRVVRWHWFCDSGE